MLCTALPVTGVHSACGMNEQVGRERGSPGKQQKGRRQQQEVAPPRPFSLTKTLTFYLPRPLPWAGRGPGGNGGPGALLHKDVEGSIRMERPAPRGRAMRSTSRHVAGSRATGSWRNYSPFRGLPARSEASSTGEPATPPCLPFLSHRHSRLLMRCSQSRDNDLKAPISLRSEGCLPSA